MKIKVPVPNGNLAEFREGQIIEAKSGDGTPVLVRIDEIVSGGEYPFGWVAGEGIGLPELPE